MATETPLKKENSGTESREEEIEINLGGLFLQLLEKWYIIVICALVGAVIFGAVTKTAIKPKYTATSKLYLVNSNDTAINLSDLQIGTQLVSDYAQVFSNWHVHEMVMERLGLNYTYSQMGSMVSVSNPSGTRVLYIKVTTPDADLSMNMANTYAEVAKEFIAVKMESKEPTIFEQALRPSRPSSPNLTLNIMLGFVAGFMISVLWIGIRFLADDHVRTPEDIERLLGLPTLGMVNEQAGAAEGGQKDKSGKKAKSK